METDITYKSVKYMYVFVFQIFLVYKTVIVTITGETRANTRLSENNFLLPTKSC